VILWMKRAIGVAALAGGLLGSSPFALVGDPATDNLPPTGELALADLTGEARPGLASLSRGPIASGDQVTVDLGDVSPSFPVTVCGDGVGVLGDASASCDTSGLSRAPAAAPATPSPASRRCPRPPAMTRVPCGSQAPALTCWA
jgi:hypothetical protein